MKVSLFALLLSTLLITVGCMGPQPLGEHDRVWVATQEVLQREGYYIQPSRYHSGTLVAVSGMSSAGLSKNRVKVVAKVVTNEDGYKEPSIRVLNQIDISDTQALVHSSRQHNHHWVNVSANEKKEAEIYNKIQQLLHKKYHSSYGEDEWRPIQDEQPKSENSTRVKAEFTPETW